MRRLFIPAFVFINLAAAATWYFPFLLWWRLVLGPLDIPALWDLLQRRHSILRNFSVAGHFRCLLEMVRPETQQYFIEKYTAELLFSRELRSVIYRLKPSQGAKPGQDLQHP